METALTNLTATIEKLVARMDALEKRIASGVPAAPAGGAAPAADGDKSPAEEEFEQLVNEKLMPLVETGKKISPIVEKEMNDFLEAHKLLQKLIGAAARSKKPADIPTTVQTVAAPLFKKLGEIGEYKEKNFRAKEIEQIAGISEAAATLSWVVIAPKPVPYLNDVIPSAEFHLNRVMRDYKDKADQKWQWQWAKDFVAYLRAHQEYVKKMHTTGLVFGGAGELKDQFGAAAPAAAPAAPSAPAPPPAAPATPAAPAKAAPDMGALFGAINKGTAITSGLKHVTAEQKTKNRPASERTSLVPGNVEKKPAAERPQAGAAAKKVKPPSKVRAGNKVMIENFTEGTIVVDDAKLNDMIYVGNCKNCTVTVKGKINGITVDSCTKVGVVVDDIVSVFEIVNSNSVQCQIVGKAPCVNIDKCTGAQLYLSKAAVTGADPTKVYTSKTSSINILVPGKSEDDDMIELAVPEQFCSVVVDGKLNTEMSSMQGM
jgi:adenylyl cyclase-associated protein